MTERRRIKPILLSELAVTIDDKHVTIKDDQRHRLDILPEDDSQLDRIVTLGHGSTVDGLIYGKQIILHEGHSATPQEATSAKGLFAETLIELEGWCKIATHVQCNGEIIIGEECEIFGDVIGGVISHIGDRTRISGNVIANGNIQVGSDVWIGGYVVSLQGSIAINHKTEVFDIICHDELELAENVKVIDRVIRSSTGSIHLPESIVIGNATYGAGRSQDVVVGDLTLSGVSGKEINCNSSTFECMPYANETEELGQALSDMDHALR
jgi:predicted acyltransferase (DUF342 family)